MTELRADQLVDLVNLTRQAMPAPTMVDLSQSAVETTLGDFINEQRTTIGSGYQYRWHVNLNYSSNGEFHGIGHTDDYSTVDTTAVATENWCFHSTNEQWDVNEMAMNTGAEQLVSEYKVKRSNMYTGLVEQWTEKLWGAAPSSSSSFDPHGVLYWVVKNASNGHTGDAASGWTTKGGLTPSNTNGRFYNYARGYTNRTDDDLIENIRIALLDCRFKPYPFAVDFDRLGMKYRFYTNQTVKLAMQKLARDKNDNHGYELNKYEMPVISGIPVVYEPELDADTSNPVYGLDLGVWRTAFLKGRYMVESDAYPLRGVAHNTIVVDVDNTFQFICLDPRRQMVLYVR